MLGCSKCGEQKPLTRFSKNPLRKRGYNYDCNDCRAANRRAKYHSNLQRTRANNRAYYAANSQRERARQRAFKLANREAIYAQAKAAREADITQYRKRHREYERSRFLHRGEYERSRRVNDLNWSILSRLRNRIRGAVYHRGVKKCAKTVELLGCSIDAFKLHIESQFQPGMSWQNRRLWHIDHKRPCALFDFRDPIQQRECFHFSNLQPLWYWQNQSKRDRVEIKS